MRKQATGYVAGTTTRSAPCEATWRNMLCGLEYNAETGDFIWTKTAGRKAKGSIAGNMKSNGYREIASNGMRCYAHQLAWALMNDRWPEGQIDHINGKRSDNRAGNLRLVTNQQNQWNAGIAKNNKSGVKGVYWAARQGKWVAQITKDYKTRSLGTTGCLGEAIRLRKAAERAEFGSYARA